MEKSLKVIFVIVLVITGIIILNFVVIPFSQKLNNIDFLEEERAQMDSKLNTATFGAGCFWCVEAVFQNLDGVYSAVSGYSGGHVDNPTYDQVCSGQTGHAEVIQIKFDSQVISFEELLTVFWNTHDPTTLNRQGADVGTQYRSAIFYHSEEQKQIAEKSKTDHNASGNWLKPILTEINPYKNFYKAEDYHQNYFAMNSNQPYCQFVIQPKVNKFQKQFKDKIKNTNR